MRAPAAAAAHLSLKTECSRPIAVSGKHSGCCCGPSPCAAAAAATASCSSLRRCSALIRPALSADRFSSACASWRCSRVHRCSGGDGQQQQGGQGGSGGLCFFCRREMTHLCFFEPPDQLLARAVYQARSCGTDGGDERKQRVRPRHHLGMHVTVTLSRRVCTQEDGWDGAQNELMK